MAVYKDGNTGKWRAVFRFTDWKGERKQTQKRGFATKREALNWEWETMLKQEAKLDMTHCILIAFFLHFILFFSGLSVLKMPYLLSVWNLSNGQNPGNADKMGISWVVLCHLALII